MISLTLDHISKSFGRHKVLDDLYLHHSEGVLGISGANGSGKSTLLRCISGLMQPTSGTVRWEMDNLHLDNSEVKKRLGFAAPYISLYRELSPLENLQFLKKLRKLPGHSETLKQLLAFVRLDDVYAQPFGDLSTGQQQRAKLASALFHQPDILLLDEPGANLDEQGRDLVATIIDQFKSEDKMVIIASNNPGELQLCDRLFSVETKQQNDTTPVSAG